MIPLNARNVRFSCAYLFRIKINDKYLLVKDEQGRNTFQPVGGVYKYTDSSFFSRTHAIQCTRFGNNSDLDCDLRINVPRNKVRQFLNWYKKEQGRETPENLYREFQEEILDRIEHIDPLDFQTIEYRFCGQHTEYSRLGEHDMQVRIADVVELIPTPQQTKAFLSLMEHVSDIYYFATKDEIYHEGRVNGNQLQTISPHSYKILPEEEHRLKRTKHSGKIYKCHQEFESESLPQELWAQIEKADITKTFTFISYNSLHGKKVWNFCCENRPPLDNIWIDRKLVSENWLDDVKTALSSPECKKAILFINKEYLVRSTACYQEASLIVDNNIPHIIVLVDVDMKFVHEQIKTWIYSDLADKNKLRIFKKLFDYDDDTGHINASMYLLSDDTTARVLESYRNL